MQVVVGAFILCALHFTASATELLPPHTMGIFADAAATQRSLELPPWQPHDIYVVAVNNDPMSGWDGRTHFIDSPLVVMTMQYYPGNAFDVGESFNHLVALGGCFHQEPTQLLIKYTLLNPVVSPPATDVLICLETTLGGGYLPTVPGYYRCGPTWSFVAAELAPQLGTLPAGCLVVNPVATVDNATRSWGTVKAEFR